MRIFRLCPKHNFSAQNARFSDFHALALSAFEYGQLGKAYALKRCRRLLPPVAQAAVVGVAAKAHVSSAQLEISGENFLVGIQPVIGVDLQRLVGMDNPF